MNNGTGTQKTCFVIMGFGEKTDYQANPQRILNLDKTYANIIEHVVVECGVKCIRADQIIHSSVIDKPMYEHLLEADLVIADLSTSNANALYELGVRHALRPHTTIVMAEQGFKFPFDLNHLSILKYAHLGTEIGYDEVMRVRAELKKKVQLLINTPETDSPVFLFLPAKLGQTSPPPPAAMEPHRDDKSFGDLLSIFQQAKADVKKPSDWLVAVAVLNRLKKLQPDDPYITQQLALATYKSKTPDALTSLKEAKSILEALAPEMCCDVETVGLWGAIHKRLWEVAEQPEDLSTALRSYGRGYYIKNDYYNGINFAFLLNARAARSSGDEAVADRVLARRVRGEILILCDGALAGASLTPDSRFWIVATKVEALLGLGRKDDSTHLKLQLVPPEGWMLGSLEEQLQKLAAFSP